MYLNLKSHELICFFSSWSISMPSIEKFLNTGARSLSFCHLEQLQLFLFSLYLKLCVQACSFSCKFTKF